MDNPSLSDNSSDNLYNILYNFSFFSLLLKKFSNNFKVTSLTSDKFISETIFKIAFESLVENSGKSLPNSAMIFSLIVWYLSWDKFHKCFICSCLKALFLYKKLKIVYDLCTKASWIFSPKIKLYIFILDIYLITLSFINKYIFAFLSFWFAFIFCIVSINCVISVNP